MHEDSICNREANSDVSRTILVQHSGFYHRHVCVDIVGEPDAWYYCVLVWNQVPNQSETPLDNAIENHWDSVNENTLCWPYGICFHGGMLAVADSGNNRVMVWDCQKILEYAKGL